LSVFYVHRSKVVAKMAIEPTKERRQEPRLVAAVRRPDDRFDCL
jgi:hypothetical protein